MFDLDTNDFQWLVDLCDKAEGVECDLMWGNELVYRVGNAMFCLFRIEDKRKVSCTFRPDPEQRESMLGHDGVEVATFPAEGDWLMISEDACTSQENATGIPREKIGDWLRKSYILARAEAANDG